MALRALPISANTTAVLEQAPAFGGLWTGPKVA
jgi:hypothetical protein